MPWSFIKTTTVLQPAAPTAHDFNRDGKADLLWRNSITGEVGMWLLNGSTLLGGAIVGPDVDLNWQIVAGGDVDGDGKADLVWRYLPTGQVAVWLLNGTTLAGGALVDSPLDLAWQLR